MNDLFNQPDFDGSNYVIDLDKARLTGQIKRVYDLMSDKQWRTLNQIAYITKDPHASISAQLRNLRKERFGGHAINKRRKGDKDQGLWEYQLIPSVCL
jgi:hypothetical protein